MNCSRSRTQNASFYDWVFWVSIASVFGFAGITYWLPAANRGEIVRGTVSLCVPLIVALLAIAIASFTIFSTLSTNAFRKLLEEQYEYLTSFFFVTMLATIATTVYAFVIFLFSYSPAVLSTAPYYWACMVGLAALQYCFLQVLDTGRAVSLQALALKALAKPGGKISGRSGGDALSDINAPGASPLP